MTPACGLCQRRPETVPRSAMVPDIVSDLYSDWDRWRGPGGACEWCVWAHRHRPLRSRPHLVNPDTCEAAALRPSELRSALEAEWPPAGLVCIPFSRKKHVAPFAQQGMVNVDDARLTWTAADAALVAVVAELRALGAGEQMQLETLPPWPLMRRHRNVDLVALWARLDPWRRNCPAKHTVALMATRKDKDPIPEDDNDDTT